MTNAALKTRELCGFTNLTGVFEREFEIGKTVFSDDECDDISLGGLRSGKGDFHEGFDFQLQLYVWPIRGWPIPFLYAHITARLKQNMILVYHSNLLLPQHSDKPCMIKPSWVDPARLGR